MPAIIPQAKGAQPVADQSSPIAVAKASLHSPRLLALHGGGTNAHIFRSQCRRLSAALPYRLVYVEAPYDSLAGPDVLSVYSAWGPFKRWLRWEEWHPSVTQADAVSSIDGAIAAAIAADDLAGATGRVVGILGFSQGAKLAASLLLRQQMREDVLGPTYRGSDYEFGILLAGRAPWVDLTAGRALEGLPDATELSLTPWTLDGTYRLRIPTLHVHGLLDIGLEEHRAALDWCSAGSARVVEWEGEHRVVLKPRDVERVVDAVLELTKGLPGLQLRHQQTASAYL